MAIKLSVCIPTYNRANFIGETLKSIIDQSTDEIEIVVSDNASTDNTEDVVQSFRATFPRLVYIRLPENLGADANFMNVVANASGEYCWLFGSDDVMREGALCLVNGALRSEPAVLLSDRMDCDYFLRPMQIRKWLTDTRKQNCFDLSTEEDFKKYFESATSLGAAFSYLSNIVVKRNLWNATQMDTSFMGTAYSHVFKIMSILTRGNKLLYFPEWTVYSRTGNDSFMEHGYVRRVLLDIDGYSALADELLKNRASEKKVFLNVLLREHPMLRLVRLVAAASEEGVWNNVKTKLLNVGFSQVVLDRAERLGTAWWFRSSIVRKFLLNFRRSILVVAGRIKYGRRDLTMGEYTQFTNKK